MKMTTKRQLVARESILRAVAANEPNIAKLLQDQQGISRPTANRDIAAAIEDGLIERVAVGEYRLKTHQTQFKLNREGLEEYDVWQHQISPNLEELSANIRETFEYGCTEMINNCVDHSEGTVVIVTVVKTALSTIILVADDGVGIFRKIAKALGLEDERQSVLELAKGKFTTDPENHSGQGIFFTSRAVDDFDILSCGVLFQHHAADEDDWVFGPDYSSIPMSESGTIVKLEMQNDSEKDLGTVFTSYEGDDFGFDKTIVPIRMMAIGEERLVSRSQAKRLLNRFDRFKEVVLDFNGVESIGQAFADEVFRVFANSHPDIDLVPIMTSEAVSKMILRVKASIIDARKDPLVRDELED